MKITQKVNSSVISDTVPYDTVRYFLSGIHDNCFLDDQKYPGVNHNFPTISYDVRLHYFSLFLKLLMTKIAFSSRVISVNTILFQANIRLLKTSFRPLRVLDHNQACNRIFDPNLTSLFQAWTGNYNVDFAHQGKPRPIPAEPVVIPPRKIIPPGRWVNCQPIRIDEGILDHQRITHLDLPQIVLTTEASFQIDILDKMGYIDVGNGC